MLGIGAGADPTDYTAFGEPFDPGRIARFDEAAGLVDAMLRGEALFHRGPAYTVDAVAVGPRAVQSPRPPIWLGGMRPGAIRRAARWDGWIAIAVSEDGSTLELSPDGLAERVAAYRAERAAIGRAGDPADVALFAYADPADTALSAAYAAAGATWWLESLSPMRGSLDDLVARVEAGPPRSP